MFRTRTSGRIGRRRIARALWAPAGLFLLAILLAGCATNPVTGRKQFSLVSPEQELEMGREGFPAVVAEYGIYEDSTVQRYVSGIGMKLAKVSHLPNLEWHFTVIDDPAVNAFAMPGGYIYVTRGILAHLNSEAQLAGVLGHEIGHVTARHSAQQLSQQQIAGLGLGVASIFSRTVATYGQAAQQALGLMFLKYSRDHENEADALGVDYATKAGYDPVEIPATYTMLKRVSDRAGQRLPGYMSTHPDPGDREVRTTNLAAAARSGKTGLLIRRPELLREVDGIVFDNDPRGGYFEGDQFYHPGLAIVMTLPAGWQHQNTHSAVTAAPASPEGAGLQITLANEATDLQPADYVTKLKGAGKIVGAQGSTERVGRLPAWVGSVAVAGDQGSERVLAAAFIRRNAQAMLQILGASAQPGDAIFNQVLTSARSLRPLEDPARLKPVPARVKLVKVPKSGSFAAVVEGLGPQALDADATSIINNRLPGDVLSAGETIKIVTAAKLH
jgi:predicted Zn-dependent protease